MEVYPSDRALRVYKFLDLMSRSHSFGYRGTIAPSSGKIDRERVSL